MKFIDLTHPVANGDPSFPNDPPLSIEQKGSIAANRYNISRITTGSHQGTHLDAMFHFYEDGRTIDRMPLDWFYGPARILRIPRARGSEISEQDLLPFESFLQPGARIILDTGWHRQYGCPAFFEEFPSLTIPAAEFLAKKQIRMLGMDMPSLGEAYYELHRALLGPDAEVVVVESLANLDMAPDSFTFCGFPLNLKGLDGSPIRAVAICD